MDMIDGWFCFERASRAVRPASFQSPELDYLFLDNEHVGITAAWCISSNDRRLIFFWGDRKRYNQPSMSMGRLGFYQRKFRAFFDEFALSKGVVFAKEVFESANSNSIIYTSSRDITDDVILDIYAGKGFIFLYQLCGTAAKNRTELHVRKLLVDLSYRGYELCRQASQFFEHVPKQILNIDLGPQDLFDQFFGPNCYDLLKEPIVPFAWPWQKALENRDGITYPKQIPTISLVMDIRNSSSAMLLTPDPSSFSMFIDRVIEEARNLIILNGGYFDKDTGDGVSGHIEAVDYYSGGELAAKNALSAAKMISTNTTRLCRDYQDNLSLKLEGLGCAVGLFFGQAVWLYSWRGVRAIGSSVVNASRICGNAGPGEVGCCNTIAQKVRLPSVNSGFFPLSGVSRPIKISEVREEAKPEAIFFHIV